MESQLDQRSILAHFDRLVEEGLVVWNDEFRTVNVIDQGVSFEFRILKTLRNKPLLAPDQPAKLTFNQPAGCQPGSDISTAGYELATLGSTHFVMPNKFPAARPHLLVLTQDGYRRQHEALDGDDFAAARRVMTALDSTRTVMLFNCGIASGCSRLHKHLHVCSAPESAEFRLWPDDPQALAKLPFKSFVQRFEGGLPSADVILGLYRGLLRQAEAALGYAAPTDGGSAVPHNVAMDRNWLVVIPRRAAAWNGAGPNAASMMGMVWVDSEEKMNGWLELGPANVLRQVGVPNDVN